MKEIILCDDWLLALILTGKGTAEDALRQIDERNYAGQYAASNKKIIKIGADFDAGSRTLNSWVQG